jgi:flagellar M-ring protein FliF
VPPAQDAQSQGPAGSGPLGPNPWAALGQQIRALTPAQRRGLAAVGLLGAAGVIVWASLAARGPNMQPLFTNLQPTTAEAIVQELSSAKIPYRLGNGGQTILVPAADVARERLATAAQGLPGQGTVGLSTVLKLPFGATNFTRQVAYQQALQGELEQTIDDIQGVSSSRVQIAMPQAATLAAAAAPASAAVLVSLKPGASLTPNQIQGIVNLVAASVQDLPPANVTVIDQTGQVLSTAGQVTASGSALAATGPAGQAASDLQVQQQFDQQLQQHLQALLDQVFGPGNVIAQVNAQLDFNSGTRTDHLFNPPGASPAVVASIQKLQQTVIGTGGATAATSVAGTAANSQPVTTYPAGVSGTSSSSSSSQVTENLDVSRRTDTIAVAPGTLSRLSVSVVVNSTLTKAQQALVQQVVQAAVGYSAARKDQVSVVGMPFNRALLTQLQKQPAPRAAALPLPLPELIGGAVLGALLLTVLVLLLRGRGRNTTTGLDGLGSEDGMAGPVLRESEHPAAEPDPLGAALREAQAGRDRVQGALRQRPEDVARVIRAWLSQDE